MKVDLKPNDIDFIVSILDERVRDDEIIKPIANIIIEKIKKYGGICN